ncbi:RHS repeat-associated core domain-containing protein [Acetivibrio clariflavus]|uniref:RHS repeat domain-containing protein n=1 Tax=Acetivibrio clariflavus TaxID=288965 RepID=UPI0031F55155
MCHSCAGLFDAYGGAREDYIYYPDGRLESLVNTDNKGVAFESYVYTYDANGNMLSKEDKKGITTYTYDNLNRLKTVDEKYSGKVTEYTYDKLGNRSTATIKENGIIIEEVYNYNLELNQLKSVITKKNGVAISTTNYEYDANGNLTSSVTDGEKTTYAYDEFNQLINADGAKYGYNAEGYRVSKNVNGSLTRYIYEYDKVVLEIDAAGNQVGRNIYGTNLLMRTADGQSYYYMYNGHADVTALINAVTGNIDATYYYDAFGNIVESTGVAKDKNSILYAGYQYDKETGLYYLNARMYDPKIARFLQEDTYTGDPNDPLSLNLYTYCANNPLIYYDPTGHVYVPLEVPIEYVNKHYKSVKEYELKLRRQAFIAEIWPTYKEDLAKSRLELRQKGWILPATKEEEEYINYIFYERSKAKRDRMLKGMFDEAKANFMDLVAIGDSLIGQKIGVNLHIGELVIRKHIPQLVNESSYIEELMSPFINSGTTKQLNFIERDLYDAEMQGRLGFLGLMTISEMAIEEAVAWQKIKKANKVLSSVDNTKQFWDDFADFLGLNKGNSKPSIWDKNWKPAVEPNLQLFADKGGVNGSRKQTILNNIAESKAARESSNFRNPKPINPGERTVEAYYNSIPAKGNPDAIKVFNSKELKKLSEQPGIDCSELAEYMYKNSGVKGEILTYKSSINKFTEIKVPIKEGIYENFYYHTVYSDGAYIYDPWYTTNPVPKDVYNKLVNSANNGSVMIVKEK